MKTGVVLLGILGLSGLSAAAAAQGAPPARTGFQMDVRTGYSIPMGKLAGEAKLSDQLSGQVPIIIDIGGKVIPELFVGGYLGFAFGGAGSAADAFCKGNGQSCTALSLHLGALIQYHILPAGAVNPWVGYGIGVESLGQGRTVGGHTHRLRIRTLDGRRRLSHQRGVRRGPLHRPVLRAVQPSQVRWRKRRHPEHRHARVAHPRRPRRILSLISQGTAGGNQAGARLVAC